MNKTQFFQTQIFEWYSKNKRDLPWRTTNNPYPILISEMMLQQTQVERVIPKYKNFLEKFPSFEILAKASPQKVIEAWAGLGYNRRAVNLQSIAQEVVQKYNSTLPKRQEQLEQLKGIGKYTASAVACFAFQQDVAVIDVNIRRIVDRVYGNEEKTGKLREVRTLECAKESVPAGKGVPWNNALMDFGSIVCTANNPKCNACPLQSHCSFYEELQSLPIEKQKELLFQNKKKVVPFIGSTRYYRGKIIKFVREYGERSIEGTIEYFQKEKEERKVIITLINQLIKERLLEQIGPNIRLPHAIPENNKF